MSRMKFSELEGKEVLSQDGRELGEVSDVTFDPSGWRIDSLVVKLERDLLESFHMKRPLFGTQTIQIATGHVSGVGDKVILRKTLMELTALARRASERESPKPETPKAERREAEDEAKTAPKAERSEAEGEAKKAPEAERPSAEGEASAPAAEAKSEG